MDRLKGEHLWSDRQFHTLTLDNGLEFAQHEKIAK